MEAAHRYEGTVNQVMGDGIMALFGAPLAHEDHAIRGCHAALRMQHSVKRYAKEIQRTLGVPGGYGRNRSPWRSPCPQHGCCCRPGEQTGCLLDACATVRDIHESWRVGPPGVGIEAVSPGESPVRWAKTVVGIHGITTPLGRR